MASSSSMVKTPLLIFLVIMLVGVSVFNFFTDRTSKVMTKEEVEKTVESYISSHPELLVSANIEKTVKDFIEQNRASLEEKMSATPTQEAINKIVADYIAAHPDAIIASVDEWQRKQVAERNAKAQENIATKKDALENDPASPVEGNLKGDITIVEFFDYSCGYCKRALPTITQLLNDDKNIKLVLKEFPILSAGSELAAKAALGVYQIDKAKFFPYHQALMSSAGQFSEDMLLSKAAELGIDKDKLKTAINDPKIMEQINNNRALARDIGVNGTPAFIINGKLVPGAIGIEEFQSIIKEARSKPSEVKAQ